MVCGIPRIRIRSEGGSSVVSSQQQIQSAPSRLGEPMRWAQLTLVDNDPGHVDLQFWLDYFDRTGSDGACLSAGGYLAYYPTEVPLHQRSGWLGDSDPFGDLVAGCRERGMVVLARTDPHAVRDVVAREHPEWIAVDSSGQRRPHWRMPGAWVTCALGPYNEQFMTQVHREIVGRYDVDGIFANRWAGSGRCFCDWCRTAFLDFSGKDLPLAQDPADPVWRAYTEWRQQRLLALCTLWDREIRSVNPAARFVPNSGGGALSDIDMVRLSAVSETLFADRQARSGLAAMWGNGKNGKEYRAVMGDKTIGGIFSVGIEERYRWKDSVQSEAEIRMWVADGTAQGLRPWFTKFAGSVHDNRWLPVVEDIYQWHRKVEPYLRNERSLARVAVMYSQQIAAFYGGRQAGDRVEDHMLGMYHALVEARIPFEMVHDGLLDNLDRFATVILPNIAVLSDEQCAQLVEFVRRGGNLVATHETSLYTPDGARRGDFGLAELFGARCTGPASEYPVQNSYLRLAGGHPILSGLSGISRIIGGAHYVPTEPARPEAVGPLTLVPSYPDLPMEEVYPRTETSDVCQLYAGQFGAGRVVYFPWDIDRLFWEILNVDHGALLAGAVRWASRDEAPVRVTGPGVIDLSVWRQRDSMTVHLVNLTNPMLLKGPVREILPLGAQRVEVDLPAGTRIAGVRLLRADREPQWTVDGDRVQVEVPGIEDHEVVAIDLAGAAQ
jgi:hypothetical protein